MLLRSNRSPVLQISDRGAVALNLSYQLHNAQSESSTQNPYLRPPTYEVPSRSTGGDFVAYSSDRLACTGRRPSGGSWSLTTLAQQTGSRSRGRLGTPLGAAGVRVDEKLAA